MYSNIGQFDGVMGPDGEGPGLKPSTAVTNNAAASPVTAAQTTNTNTAAGIAAASAGPSPLATTSGLSAGPKPKATPKPIDKSNWDRSNKVSQATVDYVKSIGKGNMGEAAAKRIKTGAPGYDGSMFSPNAPVSSEYKEAVKRVYPSAYNRSQVQYTPSTGPDRGNKRSTNTASGADAARAAAGAGNASPTPKAFPPKPSAYGNTQPSGADAARKKALERLKPNPTGAAGQNPFPKLLP